MKKLNKDTKKKIAIGSGLTVGTGAYVAYKIITSAVKVAFLFL